MPDSEQTRESLKSISKEKQEKLTNSVVPREKALKDLADKSR